MVDNFGDIGVSWRLARQLAAEQGIKARLWLDDLPSLAKIWPSADPVAASQTVSGVEVCQWTKPFPDVSPADVVIEAFGCQLPESYILAMAARKPAPVWVNLEYLSAETWVNGAHLGISPHPRLPLEKYFFFPGFVAGTGGLLREASLLSDIRSFQQNAQAQAEFWNAIGLTMPLENEVRISLFGYENPGLVPLLSLWADVDYPVTVLTFEGRMQEGLSEFLGEPVVTGRCYARGKLSIHVLPFLEQTQYDRLLWACDCNFVRGEDSFVRAQWAAKPFIWHIYPQDEEAHWKKLGAFQDIFCSGLTSEAVEALRDFWQAWNQGKGAANAWTEYWCYQKEYAIHGRKWAELLACQNDLTSQLVEFCKSKL